MSVSTARFVASGLYVPFRGIDREVSAVGTLAIDATVTGDGSAGTVTIPLAMARIEFGFHPIWIPTRVFATVNLNSAQEVLFVYETSGNERLQGGMSEEVTSRVTINGDNVANASLLSIPIEPNQEIASNVFSIRWGANNNGDVYELHMFGVLYDAEAMARGKRPGAAVDTFMAGVR